MNKDYILEPLDKLEGLKSGELAYNSLEDKIVIIDQIGYLTEATGYKQPYILIKNDILTGHNYRGIYKNHQAYLDYRKSIETIL